MLVPPERFALARPMIRGLRPCQRKASARSDPGRARITRTHRIQLVVTPQFISIAKI